MDMILTQLFIGCFMIGVTVFIHAIILDTLVTLLKKAGPTCYRTLKTFWEIPLMIGTVLGVFLAHVIQIWLWALLFLCLAPEILPDLEAAIYFSTSAFTTVGFGDVFLDKEWRLLSAFEAANGFILFGWSTAFIFEVISKIYKDEQIKKH